MQSPKESEQQSMNEANRSDKTELSEAWRTLLGLQSPSAPKGKAEADQTADQVQLLSGDPWSRLSRSKGMEPVDLQKTHLHNPLMENDEEVEHALNIMREATGQLPRLDVQSSER